SVSFHRESTDVASCEWKMLRCIARMQRSIFMQSKMLSAKWAKLRCRAVEGGLQCNAASVCVFRTHHSSRITHRERRVRERTMPTEGHAMSWSLSLGRIAGIRLYVHYTFFFLLLFFGVTDWLRGRWEAAVGGLLLFACLSVIIVLHELG